jgi:hypothetical protein
MELVLPGIEPLGKQDAPIALTGGTDSLTIDACRLQFASPLEVAGIVAIAHSPAMEGLDLTLRMPQEPRVASYLKQAGVLEALPSRADVVGAARGLVGGFPSQRMMGIRLLTTDTVADVADEFGELVSSQYPFDCGPAMSSACNELLANAEEHGVCLPGAFVAAQVYTGDTTDCPRLDLAVCDNGIGVLAHLRRNSRWSWVTRDEQALNLARQAAVSGVTDERGNGLADLINIAQRHGQIQLYLRSGFGEIRVTGSGPDQPAVVRARAHQTQGTWAWLTHQVTPTRHSVLQSGK